MKKMLATLTVLTFVLGLSASGYCQTAAKQETKPAVKTEAPAGGTQVTPAEKDKGKEAATPAAKAGEPAKGQKTEKQMSKTDSVQKASEPVANPKKETKPEGTK